MPIDLDDIFRAHEREVFAYFLRLLGNREDAEELAQETFVRACGASLRFRGDSSVRTWLFGIARRVFLETIRARGSSGLPSSRIGPPTPPPPVRTNVSTSNARWARSATPIARPW